LAFSVRQSSIPFAAKSDRTKTMRCNPATLIVAAGAGLIAITASIPTTLAGPGSDTEVEQLVTRHVQPLLIPAGGMAVAVHIDGRTLFYNYGMADAARRQPITSDSLFNLASVGKVFSSTLLAQAVERGEAVLDDPVAKYVTELQRGGDIRKVTLGQLASHTSGLHRTPQQYEPAHRGQYSLPDFIRYLNSWQADEGHEPGKQDIYSNTGFVLLPLALQRRFDTPIAKLMEQRLTGPLGMTSTVMQGYSYEARAVGEPGNIQGTFNWAGTGQMFSSARDMAVFLAANLGELPNHRPLQEAMGLAQQGVFTVGPRFTQALAWQLVRNDDLTIVDKNGGLNNTSTYIGMIPQKRLGIVILSNCGKEPATRIGRQIMLALARSNLTASDDGSKRD
jgi:beta-lactamase class C